MLFYKIILLLLLLLYPDNIYANKCTQYDIITRPYKGILITQLYCKYYGNITCTQITLKTILPYTGFVCNIINNNTCIKYKLATQQNSHNITLFAPYCYKYNNNFMCNKTDIVNIYPYSTLTCVDVQIYL